MGTLITLAMLNCSISGGGVGEDVGEGGDMRGGISGGGNYRIHCFIKLTTLLGETQ